MVMTLAWASVITLTPNGVCFVLFLDLGACVFLILRVLFEADTKATDDAMLAAAIGVEVPNTVDERIDDKDSPAGVAPACEGRMAAILRLRFPA